jgi:soluble lytic murein transglycosylase-like protein
MITKHPPEFDTWIQAAAREHGFPAQLLTAIVEVESGFDPSAVNSGDPGFAWGLGQLLPTTARFMGWTGSDSRELLAPQLNLALAGKYVGYQLKRYNGSTADAASAYNAGRTLKRADGTFGNAGYVAKVGSRLADLGTSYAALDHPSAGSPPALIVADPVAGPLSLSETAIPKWPVWVFVLLAALVLAIAPRGAFSGASGRT